MPEFRHLVPTELRPYHQYSDSLYTVDGVVMYNERIVIPPSLLSGVLESPHAAHQGVSSMISRAEHSVFWPGITPAITDLRNRCNDCNSMVPSQPSAPPSHQTLPVYPFQCIWNQGLIASLRHIFRTFGIADELSSDGSPECSSAAT